MENKVRVRFAPSPTGHLHVGNARTAILNWLFAKHAQGTFILRIEDTDRERSSETFEQRILDDLRWLGLGWDEGPDKGGDYGPYRQSERLQIYLACKNELEGKGKVYPCYCSEEELEEKRKAAMARGETAKYDRICLQLSDAERKRFEEAGRQPVWRFFVEAGEVKWQDLNKGEVAWDSENISDFVILRPDGIPTYNFAAAVDDAAMKITHIIRGDDHISNTPKQILLYQAMGWPLPHLCHIPMILGADRTRLSKRHGATSVDDFRKKGYLPEALINFVSLLSWSSESGDEILSIERLIEEFDFGRMSKSAAIFDVTKLNWMNGMYIRAFESDQLMERSLPYLKGTKINTDDRKKLSMVLTLIQDGLERLSQIPELAELYYEDMVHPADGAAIAISSKDSSQKVYWAFLRNLQNYRFLDADLFRKIMKEVQKETGLMGKELWVPIRVALTGRTHGPELPKVAEILGKEKCERFIRNLVD